MFEISRRPLTCQAKQFRCLILGLCITPILGTYLYNQGWRVAFLGCPIRHLTGIPCPTCGMTRSFMAMLRGDLNQAVAQHLFGPLLLTGFAIATVHIVIELIACHRIIAFYSPLLRHRKLQFLSLVMFLSYYALRLYHLSRTGVLAVAFADSPLGHLLVAATRF